MSTFTPAQQSYLQGFALGADVARAVRGLPVLAGAAAPGGAAATVRLGPPAPAPNPLRPDLEAQDRFLA
ncbi:MAG TPA: NirA family protein, partial [Planctomycetaceae bacterium]